MNKEDLQKQVEEMKLKLAEMEAELSKKESVFPKPDDRYWLIYAGGVVTHSVFTNDNSDNDRLAYGNFYRTKEEATKARDIQLAKIRVTNRIKELNDGWTPDWSAENVPKYCIILSTDINSLWVSSMYVTKYLPNSMYMKSQEIANQILSEMEDDIRLILGE